MKQNTHFSMEDITRYLDLPDSERPFCSYNPDMLNPSEAFSPNEASRLEKITQLGSVDTYSKHTVSKLLIDLSWASSSLEGNTYTQLDTQVLIEYGEKNKDKPTEDAAMILNHKKAIEYLLTSPVLNTSTLQKIHALLADDSLASESRHFLPPEKCGMIRSYTQDGLYITNTSYLPPQAEGHSFGFIESEVQRLLNSVNQLPDAINQSFFLMTRLPYLQAFYDVNKRTSRIACNLPLLRDGLAPLNFMGFSKGDYSRGILAIYELNDERLMKNAFINAHLSSAFRFINYGPSALHALSLNKEQHLHDAKTYVLTGVRESNPVWLRETSSNLTQPLDTPSP